MGHNMQLKLQLKQQGNLYDASFPVCAVKRSSRFIDLTPKTLNFTMPVRSQKRTHHQSLMVWDACQRRNKTGEEDLLARQRCSIVPCSSYPHLSLSSASTR